MSPWILVIRGILAFVLGLLLVIWPGATLSVILILFPIFAIIDGTSAIIIGTRTAKEGKWLSFIPMGILEIMIGVFVFFWPAATVVAFVYLMAIWAFVLGLSELFIAFGDKEMNPTARGLYAFGAIVTVILGVAVLIYPLATSLLLIWLFGLFFLVYGLILFIAGLWLRSHVLKVSPNQA